MAALALRLVAHPLPASSLAGDIVQVWRNEMARRERRRLLRHLSRLDARLIVDMGFDPTEARAVVENSWDELRPELMQRSAPWI